MKLSTHDIQSAINACEVVLKPTSPTNTPVTITQEQLSALVEVAKDHLFLNAKERLAKLEEAVGSAINTLRAVDFE